LCVLGGIFPWLQAAGDVTIPATSAFTGTIDAVYEYRYLKVLRREEVGFVIDHDAIQRVSYAAADRFRGITVYPTQQKAILFRQLGPLKHFVVIGLDEYLAELATLRDRVEVEDARQLGFSTHFLWLNRKNTAALPAFEPEVFEPEHCDGSQWKTPYDGSDLIYKTESCDHLKIPRQWLAYTEVGIPDAVEGFPFLFSKQVSDNAKTNTSVFKDLGLQQKLDEESVMAKVVDLSGRTLRKAGRAVTELDEFVYKVVKFVPGPVTRESIHKWRGFIELPTLDAFKAAFDTASDGDGDGSSHHSHNWFD